MSARMPDYDALLARESEARARIAKALFELDMQRSRDQYSPHRHTTNPRKRDTLNYFALAGAIFFALVGLIGISSVVRVAFGSIVDASGGEILQAAIFGAVGASFSAWLFSVAIG